MPARSSWSAKLVTRAVARLFSAPQMERKPKKTVAETPAKTANGTSTVVTIATAAAGAR